MHKIPIWAAATAALCAWTSAGSAAEVTLRLASTFPSSTALIGQSAVKLSERVRRASGGQVVLEFHEPGKLVPAAETVTAVAKGTVEAAWAGAGWFAGADSALTCSPRFRSGRGSASI